jgi:hypothetical protein
LLTLPTVLPTTSAPVDDDPHRARARGADARARVLAGAFGMVLSLAAPCVLAEPHGVVATIETWSGLGASNAVCQAHGPCDVSGVVGAGAAASVLLPSRVALGLAVDLSAELFGPSHIAYGPIAGVSLAPRPWMQVDLLGETGLHRIEGVGSGLFTHADGGSTGLPLPYAGVRLGWTARVGGGHARFVVGAWLVTRVDLARQTRHVSSCSSFWEGEETCMDETYLLGGACVLAGIRLGLELG